jgi:glycogen synthase
MSYDGGTRPPLRTQNAERGGRDERPLRILFATARYLPDRGGTEIHTYEVAKRLAARGAEVTVVSTAPQRALRRESEEDGVRVLRVRAWPPNQDYYLAPALVRVLRENQNDIIHCQGYHTLVAPLVMSVALTARVPLVVTLHSGGHSSRLRQRLRPLQAWLLRPLLRRANRIVAVSSFEAELFSRRLRLPREAFTVIPSGVDLPAPPPAHPNPESLLILSLGRVEGYKGHQRLIDALPLLRRVRPGVRLRVVGTGGFERQLWRRAARLGVFDLVDIAPVPADDRETMASLLLGARVVASLSDYESQGIAIQEALALGRPLVVSGDTALGELQRYPNVRTVDQRAGSEPVAQAILELLDAPPVKPPAMPTWEECTDALLQLYRDTLAECS